MAALASSSDRFFATQSAGKNGAIFGWGKNFATVGIDMAYSCHGLPPSGISCQLLSARTPMST